MITRKEWGARAPRTTTPLYQFIGWAIHWEGPKLGTFPHADCHGKVRGIQNYHMDTNRWADIAYNFIICPHGEVYEARGYGVRSAANGTNYANDRYLAVCYLGGQGDPFTEAARQSFYELTKGKPVSPHSAFIKTACPGPDLTAWVTNPLPPAKTPSIVLTNTFEGDTVKLERHLVDVPELDENGNGWIDVQVPFERVIGFIPLGPAPDRDGGYENEGWPDFQLKINNTSGIARFSIESDVPNGHVSFVVWTVTA